MQLCSLTFSFLSSEKVSTMIPKTISRPITVTMMKKDTQRTDAPQLLCSCGGKEAPIIEVMVKVSPLLAVHVLPYHSQVFD